MAKLNRFACHLLFVGLLLSSAGVPSLVSADASQARIDLNFSSLEPTREWRVFSHRGDLQLSVPASADSRIRELVIRESGRELARFDPRKGARVSVSITRPRYVTFVFAAHHRTSGCVDDQTAFRAEVELPAAATEGRWQSLRGFFEAPPRHVCLRLPAHRGRGGSLLLLSLVSNFGDRVAVDFQCAPNMPVVDVNIDQTMLGDALAGYIQVSQRLVRIRAKNEEALADLSRRLNDIKFRTGCTQSECIWLKRAGEKRVSREEDAAPRGYVSWREFGAKRTRTNTEDGTRTISFSWVRPSGWEWSERPVFELGLNSRLQAKRRVVVRINGSKLGTYVAASGDRETHVSERLPDDVVESARWDFEVEIDGAGMCDARADNSVNVVANKTRLLVPHIRTQQPALSALRGSLSTVSVEESLAWKDLLAAAVAMRPFLSNAPLQYVDVGAQIRVRRAIEDDPIKHVRFRGCGRWADSGAETALSADCSNLALVSHDGLDVLLGTVGMASAKMIAPTGLSLDSVLAVYSQDEPRWVLASRSFTISRLEPLRVGVAALSQEASTRSSESAWRRRINLSVLFVALGVVAFIWLRRWPWFLRSPNV